MASFGYLWQNRKKASIFSVLFYRMWAKRILCMPELMRRNRRRSQLVKRGASIDAKSEIGEVNISGSSKNFKMGAYSFLGKVHIALHDKVSIGNNVCINDGVQLLTASHNVQDPEWKHVKGAITIDDYVWIATNAIILPGVHIGKGAVVGAGAVVSKNIESGQIVTGNPAKKISKKRCEELNYNPCEFLAANRAWLIG